jgi:glycosyltransferase involved in cell wall biosynthesis
MDEYLHELMEEKRIEHKQVKSQQEIVDVLYELRLKDKVRFFTGLADGYENMVFPDNVVSIGTCHGLRAIEKQSDAYQTKYYTAKEKIKEFIKVALKHYMQKRYYNRFSTAISAFDIVITDSVHSAYSIKFNFPREIENKELYVLYPLTQYAPDYNMLSDSSESSYIMMISANRWIKNSYRGIKVIDGLYDKGLLKGVKTKVYGNLPRRIRNEIRNIKCFDFYEYVSSDELEQAYKKCDVLFYPTLNEGFGNVPMEAMKYGRTCVISCVCSLPEVYGDTVYYCNPYDIMEMQNRILQAIDHKKDPYIMKNRLDFLKNRQTKDMDTLCKLIKGNI